MSDDVVARYELRGDVAWIQMDDGKANALSFTMLEQLARGLDEAEKNAKAVVLLGRPGRFCAGFDLKVMMSGPEAARKLVLAGGDLLMRVYGHPQPVIIGCTGHAIAGGSLLVATGDERIGASGDFRIGLNEVQNAMPVPILAHELARDRLDPRQLTRAVLHAHLYDPDGARDAGWLDRVVDPGSLEAECASAAERLGQLPGGAFAASKRSLRRRTMEHVRDTIQANLDEFSVG